MHLPLAAGALLLRDPHAAQAIEKRAPYMLQEQSGDLGAHSLEGSRPCSALLMHAALQLTGRRGYERMIDDSIRNAQFMAREIERHDELELLTEPETNIVLFRVVPPCWRDAVRRGTLASWQHETIGSINHAAQSRLVRQSDVSVSRTMFEYALPAGGHILVTALRAVLGNPHTTEADISLVIEEHVRLAVDLFAMLEQHGRLGSYAPPADGAA
jgi:glutamate decarboxylase